MVEPPVRETFYATTVPNPAPPRSVLGSRRLGRSPLAISETLPARRPGRSGRPVHRRCRRPAACLRSAAHHHQREPQAHSRGRPPLAAGELRPRSRGPHSDNLRELETALAQRRRRGPPPWVAGRRRRHSSAKRPCRRAFRPLRVSAPVVSSPPCAVRG